MGKSRCHPFAQGLIVTASHERIEPDQPLHPLFQAFHLRIEKLAIPAIPPITEEEEEGTTRAQKIGMLLVKPVKSGADVCPSRPIEHPPGEKRKSLLESLPLQQRGNTA